MYELKSIVHHEGDTLLAGHYTCSVVGENNKWYHVNDATITRQDPPLYDETAYMVAYALVDDDDDFCEDIALVDDTIDDSIDPEYRPYSQKYREDIAAYLANEFSKRI